MDTSAMSQRTPEPLSEQTQLELSRLVKMHDRFAGFFNRRAHQIVGTASNETTQTDNVTPIKGR